MEEARWQSVLILQRLFLAVRLMVYSLPSRFKYENICMLLFWNISLSYLTMSKKNYSPCKYSKQEAVFLPPVRSSSSVYPSNSQTGGAGSRWVLCSGGSCPTGRWRPRGCCPGTAAARWGRAKPAGLSPWDPARSAPSSFSVSQVWFGSVRGTRRDPSQLSSATSREPGVRPSPCLKKQRQQRALGHQHPPAQPVLAAAPVQCQTHHCSQRNQ